MPSSPLVPGTRNVHANGQPGRRGVSLRFFFLAALASLGACSPPQSPQAAYEHAKGTFVHGDLATSQQEAERGYQRFRNSSPEWAWRFRVLEGQSLLWSGSYREVLALFESPAADSAPEDLHVSIVALQAVALARQHDLGASEEKLRETDRLCAAGIPEGCGEAFQARGLFALGQNQYAEARQDFERGLAFARAKNDAFLETTSLLNLGGVLVKEGRYDEAVDSSDGAYKAALALKADDIALAAQENLAWSYYRLGDSDRALDLMAVAERRAEQLGDTFDEENGLTNIGYVYLDERRFELAEEAFSHALAQARVGDRKEHMLNALRVLARLSLQMNDAGKASEYAAEALSIAHASGNHADEIYPTLVQGQIAAHLGDAAKAKQIFQAVEGDSVCPTSLRWEAQHSLARLYEEQKQPVAADREYRTALATFETARADVRHEDFRLSFVTNGARIYDDYVHFLVTQGTPEQALRWADYSRARTLAEGLGLLSNERTSADSRSNQLEPPRFDARSIARRARGALLFYWLGEKQSYLWAITSQKTELFTLPPGPEIEAAVRRYRTLLKGPQDALQSGGDARSLYGVLIAPAQSLLAQEAKVFILPDGGLNNLNFETLVVPSPGAHYWIEDADVVNASSLRVLAASLARRETGSRKLLLIGDSVAVSNDYPELPGAADQMASVARNFAATEQRVYQHELATPAAYLQNRPEQFSYIHFVAHGTASRLSPLDSAIVLSKEAANRDSANPDSADTDSANPDSFKLYARDIIHHHLRADLVTISACYGAGERQYSGEGLVGLAWAFQFAGARNVIAALWEVTDPSTDKLMSRFYQELAKGAAPDVALRTAKLALLRGDTFHSPFYWAPFQLYTG